MTSTLTAQPWYFCWVTRYQIVDSFAFSLTHSQSFLLFEANTLFYPSSTLIIVFFFLRPFDYHIQVPSQCLYLSSIVASYPDTAQLDHGAPPSKLRGYLFFSPDSSHWQYFARISKFLIVYIRIPTLFYIPAPA